MSLISKAINHLFGGVSQQAASLRDSSQCELMENCWPEVSQGLGKRPPVLHGAKLNSDTDVNRKIHQINRDGGEQYVVTLKNNEIKVYDRLTGAEKTVATPDGLGYLAATDPLSDFALVTVADTTFIVNKTKVVTLDAAADSAPAVNTVHFVTIKSGVISTDYNISLPGLVATYTTSTSYTKTDGIAAALTTTVDAHANYVAERLGNTIKITRADATAFTCTTTDSWGDNAMYSFSNSVQNTSQLPSNFWTGYVIKVRGGLDSGKDDYYVKFEGDIWKETVPKGLQNSYTASTLPHLLTRLADGTFTFTKAAWASREVGDADSNPAASFVGKTINGVFFYRERLGFLSAESVIMSRVSDYYNFWYSTASGQLDDDPIDASVADVKVAYLYHAVPFQDSLLLFSDAAQYQLSGGETLTAANVRIDPTTRFSSSKTLAPSAAGRNVFFAVNKGTYSSVREYFVMPGFSTSNDAVDVTAHVPAYVPQGIKSFEASALVDALVAISSQAGNEIYCYKYLWNGEKKVQSSWGKWVLDSGATVLSSGFVDATLALVVVRSDGTYVESVNLQSHAAESGMDRAVYLDRRVSLTGVYSAVTGKTTWTLPYVDSGTFQVVLGAGFGNQAGIQLNTSHPTTTTVEATGDYSAYSCFVGKPYTMRYRFSEFFIKGADDVALQTGRLQLRTLTVSFSTTGYFRMEVTPKQRETSTYSYTARITGGVSATVGTNPTITGKHKFPVIANSSGVTIDLVNDSPSPSFFQGAEWEGLYVQRTKRA